jgi:hypothetical protein
MSFSFFWFCAAAPRWRLLSACRRVQGPRPMCFVPSCCPSLSALRSCGPVWGPCFLSPCVRRLLSSAERTVGQSTHAPRDGKGRAHCTPLGEGRATTAHPSARAESTHTAHTMKKRTREDRARQAGHRLPLKTHKCAWRQIKGCQTL